MADSEFKQRMQEWVTIKKQLKEVRKDISVLTSREKELKKFIQVYMKSNEIDACNLQDAKVSYTQRKYKGSFNRDVVRRGLSVYFSGNEAAVKSVMDAIEAQIETGHKDSISVRISENGVE